MDEQTHTEVIEAMRLEHRLEIAKLRMRLVSYREILERHGIEPPDHDDDELLAMWQSCRAVISTASYFSMQLRSAKELLA